MNLASVFFSGGFFLKCSRASERALIENKHMVKALFGDLLMEYRITMVLSRSIVLSDCLKCTVSHVFLALLTAEMYIG
jgi:hypothetical protein